ncbi:MAG: glutathione S-transferase family protein [Polyangiales bacterium]
MQRLITISFSHYCEKARWALDLAGVAYREEGHLPLFHFLPVGLATRGAKDKRGDSVSSPLSTPVLITSSGERICDSTRILRHVTNESSELLRVDSEALELEAKFSKELGPHTRRYGYHFLLGDTNLMRRFFWSLGNKPEAAGAALLYPLYTRAMRKALNINAKSAERSKHKVLAIAAEVEERLSDGRAYLCGDTFSVADLSYAALFAPSLLLTKREGYGSEFPGIEQVGGEPAEFAQEMRERRAGEFALSIYEKHRGRSSAVA